MKKIVHNRKSRLDSTHNADSRILKKSNLLKIITAGTVIVFSLGATLPSLAALDSTNTSEDSIKSESATAISIDTQVQKITEESQSCADPANVDGLAYAQAQTLGDLKKLILTTINTDKIFNAAENGGCFDALKDFPNLSGSIPSLTGIASALKQTLINYATRKVCNAVNDALTELLDPLNEVMDELSSNGQIDLTGAINKEMSKKLYEIDPQLGRVSTPITSEITWKSTDIVDLYNTDSVNPQNIQQSTSTQNSVANNSNTTQTEKVDNEPVGSLNGLIGEPKKSIVDSFKSVINSIF